MATDTRVRTEAGLVVYRGAPLAGEAAMMLATSEQAATGAWDFGGARVFVKASPLRGASARRHMLRRRLLGRHLPRVREYENLGWLRERVFQVPQPFGAAVLWRHGLPRFQALVTEWVPGIVELDAALGAAGTDGTAGAAGAEERRALAAELGSEVARMHALGFVHRDLFPRNLLVLPAGPRRRIVFVDAWRAAPHASLRGPAYDLACLFLEGARLWSEEEQQVLLDAYAASRASHGRAAPLNLLRRARRARQALVRRLERDPARLRGGPAPAPWSADLRWVSPR